MQVSFLGLSRAIGGLKKVDRKKRLTVKPTGAFAN